MTQPNNNPNASVQKVSAPKLAPPSAAVASSISAPVAAKVPIAPPKPVAAPVAAAPPVPVDALEAQESRAVKWIVGAFIAGTVFCIAAVVVILTLWSRSPSRSAVVPAPATPRSGSTAIVPGRVRKPALTPEAAPRRTHGVIDYNNIPSTIPRLNYAARHHDVDAIARFIKDGDDVNSLSHDGLNAPPVIYAAMNNNDAAYDALKMLLDHGGNANAATKRRTALMEAVLHRSPRSAALLLEKGADPTFVNSRGESAASIAKANGDTGMMKLVEEGTAKWKDQGKPATTNPN